MKQPFQLATEIAQILELPETLEVTECKTLDPASPNIYINDFRIVGGKPAFGRNLIRKRKMRTTDYLQSLPIAALRKLHGRLEVNQ